MQNHDERKLLRIMERGGGGPEPALPHNCLVSWVLQLAIKFSSDQFLIQDSVYLTTTQNINKSSKFKITGTAKQPYLWPCFNLYFKTVSSTTPILSYTSGSFFFVDLTNFCLCLKAQLKWYLPQNPFLIFFHLGTVFYSFEFLLKFICMYVWSYSICHILTLKESSVRIHF